MGKLRWILGSLEPREKAELGDPGATEGTRSCDNRAVSLSRAGVESEEAPLWSTQLFVPSSRWAFTHISLASASVGGVI